MTTTWPTGCCLRTEMPLTARVRTYVHAHHATLAQQFDWRLNTLTLLNRLGVAVAGATSYDKNIDLKVQLAGLWARADLATRRQIARYYVVDWGGVKRNSEAKLNGYVDAAVAAVVPPLPGIASWSKVLAASDPSRHAIFDARVSLALNVLQLGASNGTQVLFPALPGQNTGISTAGKRLQAQALAAGWRRLQGAEVYSTYIEVLQVASQGLPGPLPLATAEMVLFAHAPQLAAQVPP
ncbi:MAG: hypothetical protein JSR75_19705 [Proteobacteria bacterium]|nr:hypothetical protein [Pseudomonadota bacterium]